MSLPIEISSLVIGIIVISIVAGIGLFGLVYLLVRQRKSNNNNCNSNSNSNRQDLELNNYNHIRRSSTKQKKKKKKRVFSLSSKEKDVPVTTSSLDTHDVFFTILEYPPTKPPTCIPNNRLLDVPMSEDKLHHHHHHDPISVSLARQSIEERSGYYKSPTRTPVPYYNQKQSSITSGSTHLIMMDEHEAMQRWSTSSYHVW
ncbi:hypothetical protein BD770DRAFT_385242 [Pilaira anomala]|nr:hypothetical protein BD770DRAFT_385242 [Pilaira anomala]